VKRFLLWLGAGAVLLLAALAGGAIAPDSGFTGTFVALSILWATITAVLLFWLFWRWVAYRVSVRLFISYLLIGVTPFVFMAVFFGAALYMAMGQYTSVRYGSVVERLGMDLMRDCGDVVELFESSGSAAAVEAFEAAAARQRDIVPRVLWRARLDGLSLSSPGAEALPVLDWIVRRTTAIVRHDDELFTIAAAVGSEGRARVVALVPLDDETARSINRAAWFDVYFAPLQEDFRASLEEGGDLRITTSAKDLDSVTVNDRELQVGEVWSDWEEAERGLFWTPWIWWFRLAVEVRDLGTGQEMKSVISLLRTSPAKVWEDFTRSKYELGTTLWAGLLGLGAFFLAVYGLALLIAVTMIFSIARSTSRLTSGAREVERGNFDHRIPVKRHDQLGELAVSFNSMTQSVQDMLVDVAEKERLARELELAREIQESLLPDRHLQHGSLSVHATFRPAAAVGGDYFDIFPLDEQRLVIVVGDVAGHGLQAGLLMASLKSSVAALVGEGYAGVDLVAKVNSLILSQRVGPTLATLSVVEIDTAADRLRLTNAGHPPAYLIGEGAPEELLASSLPLGSPRCEPRQLEGAFPAGTRLLLYSDGLVEATDRDGEPFSYERLARKVKQARKLGALELQAAILKALDEHIDGRSLDDDLTLLVIDRGM
jgi:serine phosphatase RsbU (regulator of sigma subunit)